MVDRWDHCIVLQGWRNWLEVPDVEVDIAVAGQPALVVAAVDAVAERGVVACELDTVDHGPGVVAAAAAEDHGCSPVAATGSIEHWRRTEVREALDLEEVVEALDLVDGRLALTSSLLLVEV